MEHLKFTAISPGETVNLTGVVAREITITQCPGVKFVGLKLIAQGRVPLVADDQSDGLHIEGFEILGREDAYNYAKWDRASWADNIKTAMRIDSKNVTFANSKIIAALNGVVAGALKETSCAGLGRTGSKLMVRASQLKAILAAT